MNLAERKKLAQRIVDIGLQHGAVNWQIEHNSQYRDTYVQVDFARASVNLDIGDAVPGLLCHWVANPGRKFNPNALVFDSINEVHFGKATLYRTTNDAFMRAFERACKAVSGGTAAFQQEEV